MSTIPSKLVLVKLLSGCIRSYTDPVSNRKLNTAWSDTVLILNGLTICISYISPVVVKYHDEMTRHNLQEKQFTLNYGFREIESVKVGKE